MSIYFMRSGNAVKIGLADDFKSRLSGLQVGNPEPIVFVAAMGLYGAHATRRLAALVNLNEHDLTWRKVERALHQRFRHLRIRGEWFRWSQEIEDFINSCPFCYIPTSFGGNGFSRDPETGNLLK